MFDFPADVKAYLNDVFAGANHFASSYLTQVPNAHEPSLDTATIAYIARKSRPVKFDSNWTIKLDTHFIGSGRHWGRWEIADIGLLLMFRRGGDLLRTKVALLQSKRLYPNEQKGDDQPNYHGFGALRESEQAFLDSISSRSFAFDGNSKYKALNVDDGQYSAINDYETLSQIPVYYLFYNPMDVPTTIEIPCQNAVEAQGDVNVGCRVLPYQTFRNDVAPNMATLTPAYDDVCYADTPPFDTDANSGGWRLEDFVVNRFLGCETGYRVDTDKDSTLLQLFGGRSAPIAAAISINIDVPQGTDPIVG